MNILQIIPSLQLAGAETMCENLCYQLINGGHIVEVLSLYSIDTQISKRMQERGIKIIFTGKKTGFDLRCIQRIKQAIKVFKPDVIHTHLYSLKYAVFASRGKIPIIHTLHSLAEKETTSFQQKINRFFYKKRLAYPVALSEENKASFINVYKLKDVNVPIIYNGIDLKKCFIKSDYSIRNVCELIHVGRFAEVKNHFEMLKAIELLKKEGYLVHLSLIGDGELKNKILLTAKELQIEQNVSLLGLKDSVFEYLTKSDIFVLPSIYEGIPMTIIEAMGTGLPIVASKVGGIPNLITDYENGVLCEPNYISIYEKIKELIDNSDLRKRCGLNALKKSHAFSSESMCTQYTLLYREALNNNDK